jgi:ribosome biogenesis GTPase A
VGDQPAVTRGQQKFNIDAGISVFDTPGVLWPKLEDQAGAYKLAASGAIRETAFDPIDVAEFAVELLARRYPDALRARFKSDELPEGGPALLDWVGRRRGLLAKGGAVDLERAAELLLRELQKGTIGRISLEGPEVREPAAGNDAEGPALDGAPDAGDAPGDPPPERGGASGNPSARARRPAGIAAA